MFLNLIWIFNLRMILPWINIVADFGLPSFSNYPDPFQRFYPGCWKSACALVKRHESEYGKQNKFSRQQFR